LNWLWKDTLPLPRGFGFARRNFSSRPGFDERDAIPLVIEPREWIPWREMAGMRDVLNPWPNDSWTRRGVITLKRALQRLLEQIEPVLAL